MKPEINHIQSETYSKTAPKAVDLRQLLGGSNEIKICHDDQEYRLRLTKNNKLILTK